jgi:HAD superfamily hydrolase (TIGR01493 family)
MSNNRREFMKLSAATASATGIAWAATPAAAQTAGQFKGVKALAFDAYGTLFDVFSVTALCEQLFPGKGTQLAQTWRFKQLQYSLMRSLMGCHRDFWGLTEDGLVWASKNLKVDLTADKKKQLMDAYLTLAAFPDVKLGLEATQAAGAQTRYPVKRRAEDAGGGSQKRRHPRSARRDHQRRGGEDFQDEQSRLLARDRAAEGEQSGAGLCLGQQLGWGRRRLGAADTANRRGSS